MTDSSNIRIPYVNIAQQHRLIKSELIDAVDKVIEHGRFILGEEVTQFEQEFARLCGTRFAVAVNSGTDALILALRALGIGKNDEVITSPNSFVASAACIVLAGATPVFVDVLDNMSMDWSRLKSAITPRTKAILPIHLTGLPADMSRILQIAGEHNLFVIEDAAQAVMAEHREARVGSFGKVGCFSLHPLKTLNACGDGGILTTNDKVVYDKLLLLRNLGLRNRNECVLWSGNSRLDTLQAAVLLVKLRHLDEWTALRRRNAAFYTEALSGIDGLRLPIEQPYEKAVYHTFVIQTPHRDELKSFLLTKGIETAIHYPTPIHLQEAAISLGYSDGDFPVAEKQAREVLSLPVYPELGRRDIFHIADCVRDFFRHQH